MATGTVKWFNPTKGAVQGDRPVNALYRGGGFAGYAADAA